jgi:hypothetical protein
MPLHWIGRSVCEHRVIKPRVSSRLFPDWNLPSAPALATAVGRTRHPVSSGRHSFKKTDLVRALLAAKEAGLPVGRVEIDPATGTFSLITKQGEAPAPDEIEDWIKKHADQIKGR